jgi:hypothetical protein
MKSSGCSKGFKDSFIVCLEDLMENLDGVFTCSFLC